LDRFTWIFSSSALIDGALLVLALLSTARREFKPVGLFLLSYAISALYGDYNLGMEMRDKALATAFATSFTLPPSLDFIVDLVGRIALLIAIWMSFALIKHWPGKQPP
jgi:hypothetical protein